MLHLKLQQANDDPLFLVADTPKGWVPVANFDFDNGLTYDEKVKIVIDIVKQKEMITRLASRELPHVVMPCPKQQAIIEKLETEKQFIIEYLNPADTSFRNMIDGFKTLPSETQEKLSNLAQSMKELAEIEQGEK